MTYAMPFQQTLEGCRIDGVDRWETEAAGLSVGLQVIRPRSVPWLRVVRVPRFGRGLEGFAMEEVVEALARLARRRPVLRMHVEVWSEHETERATMAAACSARGFVKAKPRSYTETVWLDLSLPADDLLGSFHRSARRNIKIPQKKGMAVRTIIDAAAIPRIREIFANVFRRTGGVPPPLDWELLIGTNGRPGCRHNVVGLFPSADAGPAEMLSFAVAFLHGEVAEFAHAGSAREPGFRVPLSYAPAWELMVWARAKGARFWDFGGVTSSAAGGQGPLAGINAFKRYFSPRTITVGEEWVLEPRRVSAAFARTVSKLLSGPPLLRTLISSDGYTDPS
jgi:hypothetical protein